MRNENIWEVKAKNIPLLKRKCNRCDNDNFYCSEKFRINAQKKNIDIWLIYNCVKCDSTYNLTILSRTKSESINKDLFNKFSENNLGLVWEYAFSQETARRNNVKLDFESVEYNIIYENFPIEDILNSNSENVTFKIKYPYDFKLRLSAIIRICLNLSAKQLKHLLEAKVFSVEVRHLKKKHKAKNQDVVQINTKQLKNSYK